MKRVAGSESCRSPPSTSSIPHAKTEEAQQEKMGASGTTIDTWSLKIQLCHRLCPVVGNPITAPPNLTLVKVAYLWSPVDEHI